MTATLVKPITCRSCKGTGGFTYASGMPGTCGSCGGSGKVEGDKATIAAYNARIAEHRRIYPILKALADKAPRFHRTFSLSFASDGLYLLEANEPERYTKAVVSIEAGHPAVVQALSDYYTSNR